MTRPLRHLIAASASITVALATAGCATSLNGLEFHNDNRMKITAPHENSLVRTPLALRWTMKDFTVAGIGKGPVNNDTGYFAIFIDRSPIKAGQTLNSVNKGTPSCQHTSACTTRSYLAHEQVFTTTNDYLKVDNVADISGNNESTQYHTATVILMDTAGRRISESAWSVEFRMHSTGGDD